VEEVQREPLRLMTRQKKTLRPGIQREWRTDCLQKLDDRKIKRHEMSNAVKDTIFVVVNAVKISSAGQAAWSRIFFDGV
jgi:hypothetical protein